MRLPWPLDQFVRRPAAVQIKTETKPREAEAFFKPATSHSQAKRVLDLLIYEGPQTSFDVVKKVRSVSPTKRISQVRKMIESQGGRLQFAWVKHRSGSRSKLYWLTDTDKRKMAVAVKVR